MKKNKSYFVKIILILAAFLWGLNPAIVKIGLGVIPPLPYTSVRLLFAAIVSWTILLISKTHKKVEKKDYPKFILVGFGGMFFFQFFFTFGVKMTAAANTSVILCLVPLSVIFINRFFRKESVETKIIIGAIATLVGVAFIAFGTSTNSVGNIKSNYIGIALLLITQFAFAIYTVFAKDLLEKYSHYQVSAYIFTITMICFVLVSIRSIIEMDWSNIHYYGWLSSFYSGVFSICIANSMWIWGIKKIGSNKTSVYNNLPPIFSILAGYILLGETFGVYQIVGSICIILGLYITSMDLNKVTQDVKKYFSA